MDVEAGRITRDPNGQLNITIERSHYHISPEDIHELFTRHNLAPICRQLWECKPNGERNLTTSIVGHATIHHSGKVVVLFTLNGHYIVPRVSMLRVARGDATSAPLFPYVPEGYP